MAVLPAGQTSRLEELLTPGCERCIRRHIQCHREPPSAKCEPCRRAHLRDCDISPCPAASAAEVRMGLMEEFLKSKGMKWEEE